MRFVTILATVAVLASAAAAADKLDGFQTSWAQAQKLAKEQNKLIYAHFTTTWCGWCRKIEKDIYATPEGKKVLADFVPVTLDCTVPEGQKPAGETKINLDLLEKFGGEGYPYLVMASPEGEVFNIISGYVPMEEFKKQLALARDNYKEYLAFEQFAATADKKSYEYNARAMTLFAKLHKEEPATAAAREVLALDPENKKGNNADANLVLIQAMNAKEGPDKMLPYLKEIQKLDPRNEKGVLEKAYIAQAERNFRAWQKAEDAAGNAYLKAIVDIANEALNGGWKIHQPDEFYGMLIFCNGKLGDRKAQLAAAKKMLAANPDGPQAERLKQFIEQMEDTSESPAAK